MPPALRSQSIDKNRSSVSLVASCIAALCLATPLAAQTSYTAVDLTPTASGVAQTASAGQAAGFTGSNASAFVGRATLWTGDGAIDLHPAFLSGIGARSVANGFAGNLQVGSGADASTGGRNVPLAWRDTAASAKFLPIPFVNAGGQANATDGVQIVGSAIGYDRDGTTLGGTHALIWNVATGAVLDIGTDASVFGVRGGQQVGYVLKGAANAALWRGTKSYTLLHPKNAVTSSASDTDGVRQVGYASFDIRVRSEAANGNHDRRFTYAHVWTGTAASALNIHPYASNFSGIRFEFSYAVAVSSPWIAGYATDPTKFGNPAYYHAIVWDGNYQATDLNAFIPEGFIGAQAFDVDSDGNVSGVMTKADGTRHAVLWIPNP